MLRQKLGGAVRLGLVLALLVGVNIYVFFFSPGSLKQVSQAAQAASTRGVADPGLVQPAVAPAPAPAAATPPPRVKPKKHEGNLKEHEGLGAMLRREGLTPADADGTLRALAQVMTFKKEVHAGLSYTVRLDAAGRLEELELRTAPGVTVRVSRGADGKLAAERLASTPRLVHH